jgi:hypothetical protein
VWLKTRTGRRKHDFGEGVRGTGGLTLDQRSPFSECDRGHTAYISDPNTKPKVGPRGSDPYSFGYVMRTAVQIVWEGIALHQWRFPQKRSTLTPIRIREQYSPGCQGRLQRKDITTMRTSLRILGIADEES